MVHNKKKNNSTTIKKTNNKTEHIKINIGRQMFWSVKI